MFCGVVVDTVIPTEWDALCSGDEESTTFAMKLKLPDCVGVPEILPVEAVSVRPVGRLPVVMLQV